MRKASSTFLTASSLVALLTLWSGQAAAQMIVYPAKGQSAQQQRTDEGNCYVWARDRTGIDPAAGQPAPTASQPTGNVARGVVGGAMRGAVIASVADGSAGRGAAAGAVMGGVRGVAREQKSQQQAARQAQASGIQQFNRAYAACLEGRGYTVK